MRKFVLPASSVFTREESELGSQQALVAGRSHSSKWQAEETQGTAPGTRRGAGKSFPVCCAAKHRRPEFVAVAGGKLRNPLGGRV